MSRTVVSVNIMGGLGNQLFQIASAYAYAKRENARLLILEKKDNGNRPVYWNTFLERIAPLLTDVLPAGLMTWREDYPTMYKELPSPPPLEGIFLTGYFQSSKYFYNNETKNDLRNLFAPSESAAAHVQSTYKHLLGARDRVIVIHARQTDYLLYPDIHAPLTPTYYRRALELIRGSIEDPIYVLASDDNTFWDLMPELRANSVIVCDTDVHTMALLQQFKNFIISNSTFIWWCAFMADAPSVIAPAGWFGPGGPARYDDIYEKGWTIL